MYNFQYYNPTKIFFGKDQIKELDNILPKGKRIMIVYGGGSIKTNGVLSQVEEALKGNEVFFFSGIEPNPHYETCIKCVEELKNNGIDFVLAVGGGSVIDATKFIVAAFYYENKNYWEILETNGKYIKKAMPFGTVLTLPATGSEMNSGSVITKKETLEKRAFHSQLCFPQFSILDPQVTFSLPDKQITNGIVDTFVHVIEQYLTYNVDNQIGDRFSESILSTLIYCGERVFLDKTNYDIRANLMWAATLGLNGLIACGSPEDWATHMIGHELTAFYNLDHGVTLSIVLIGVMNIMKEEKKDKILQMGERVFNIYEGTIQERIEKTIYATESFFKQINSPTRLCEVGLDEKAIEPIVKRMLDRNWSLGENGTINYEKVRLILEDRL
ncbi:MAG: iron-containing alcohol dehydrogenase [Bacteroidales bacterium]|jgi:NADP-dependent alcohol dehydrogenase|nr:iron-containing alcohol dehydrogenase [Bacteroidales bacterium]